MCRGARLAVQHPQDGSSPSTIVCNCHEQLTAKNQKRRNQDDGIASLTNALLLGASSMAQAAAAAEGVERAVTSTTASPSSSTTTPTTSTTASSSDEASSSSSPTQSLSSSVATTPPPPPPQTSQPANHRQRSFMARSIASRTVSFIEAEVEALVSECRFINVHSQKSSSAGGGSDSGGTNKNSLMQLNRAQIEVGHLLGEGGFSSVYEVRDIVGSVDKTSSSSFVIKHLRREVVTGSSQNERVDRSTFYSAAADLVWEAKCLAALDHPNIIKLRGVSEDDVQSFGDGSHDSYFLLLDRVDETLTHQLHRWRKASTYHMQQQQPQGDDKHHQLTLPNDIDMMEEKLDIARQVASALQYLHDHNIIFRDIKPSNVGLKRMTPSGSFDGRFYSLDSHPMRTQAVLFDFGLCRELPFSGTTEQERRDEFFHMSMVGTRRYIAPEVALGDGYNLQADVYSFTLMVYELMTLVTPYAMYSREMHDLLVVRDNVRPDLSPSWPQDVRSFFQNGWARHPIDRPTISQVIKLLDDMATNERFRRLAKVDSSNQSTDSDVGTEPERKKTTALKRKISATRKVWFQSVLFDGLPSLLRKASSSFYESGGSCCNTASTSSVPGTSSDLSIAETRIVAE